ncbi:hypothetical protein FACS189483_01420 [Spirochaetia bacterium]|nr:hypothetical protein FACS189483_01420 [Spirochaetia bacterium]
MRISIRGNDRGNAILLSVSLILILSLIFVSLVPRIIALDTMAKTYKAAVIREIDEANREIMQTYDL